MENCFRLSHKDTVVALDDTIFTKEWQKDHNIGPTRTWIEHVSENKITELSRKEYSRYYGMSCGKYVF
jgi:hypothetical protein